MSILSTGPGKYKNLGFQKPWEWLVIVYPLLVIFGGLGWLIWLIFS